MCGNSHRSGCTNHLDRSSLNIHPSSTCQVLVLAMAPGLVMAKAASGVLEESALGLAHHHCTTALGHWHRRFRCKFRSSQQTDGTNQCCHRRNRHSLPRICSNLQMLVAPAQVMVLAHHRCTMAQGRWHRRFHCRFQCRSRNLQRTGGTNQCCHRHSQRNLARICSNLLRQVRAAPAQVRVARDHYW